MGGEADHEGGQTAGLRGALLPGAGPGEADEPLSHVVVGLVDQVEAALPRGLAEDPGVDVTEDGVGYLAAGVGGGGPAERSVVTGEGAVLGEEHDGVLGGGITGTLGVEAQAGGEVPVAGDAAVVGQDVLLTLAPSTPPGAAPPPRPPPPPPD